MHKRLLMFMIVVLIAITVGFATLAQDVDTPTPAPSKTPAPPSPTSVATDTPTLVASTETPSSNNLRRYLQSDLQILVGNVQRPNGIVWFNDNLYAACNGDFTLYEIDSVTGSTITFSSGVRDINTLWIEELDNGFNIWLPDFDTNQLLRADHLRGLPTVVINENLDGPWGIAYLDDSNFLITNALSNNIVLANRDGTSNIIMDGLRYPTGIVVDSNKAYVANRGSARRAIEWFDVTALDPETISDELTRPLVSGLQNVSNLVLADDGYLYFTYALAERGVVGRVNPDACRDGGCTNEEVEIVILTDGRTAPLAGLTISDDMRLFVHTVYDSEIFWVQLYD
ncbi:MAG: hypothetical protein Q9P01_05240 [Anaerolineae bacterium]|nr:hypothetical protein [Anaerolineae bacterium]MDQ7034242.1 hypothetical protein [Anaerolineae bacterium]